jgi:hypothetical protein
MPVFSRSDSSDIGGTAFERARWRAWRSLWAFRGERRRWAVSRRLESSAAETRATSSADLRLMITGYLDEETWSHSVASLALASEYVVTVMSHRLSCTEILYN